MRSGTTIVIMIIINPDKKEPRLEINMFGEQFHFVRIIVTWIGSTRRLD
jgi:hypothetical protein